MEKDINENYKLLDDTFSIQNSQSLINVYKLKISDIICEYLYLDLETILDELKSKYHNILDDIVYHAIDQMINDKFTIRYNKIEGYLHFSDNIYYFQPSFNTDIFLTSYYRINPPIKDYNDYKLIAAKKILLDIPEVFEFKLEEMYEKFDEILTIKLSPKEQYIFDINILTENDYFLYIIER